MINLVFAEPFVLQKYPPDYNDEVSFLFCASFFEKSQYGVKVYIWNHLLIYLQETLNSIPKFAFPCDTDR